MSWLTGLLLIYKVRFTPNAGDTVKLSVNRVLSLTKSLDVKVRNVLGCKFPFFFPFILTSISTKA